MIRNRTAAASFAPLALLSLFACQLPDVAPFHVATVELEQSMKTVGVGLAAGIREAGLKDKGGNPLPDDANHPAAKLEAQWKPRLESMAALTEYSRSLTNIASSAMSAEAKVESTMKAAETLASQFGGSIASQEVSSLVISIGGALIKIKAANSMSRAVENLDPLLVKITEIFEQDLERLRNFTRDWLRRNGARQVRDGFGPWIDDYARLRDRQEKLGSYAARVVTARLMLGTQPTAVDDFLDELAQDEPFDAGLLVAAAKQKTDPVPLKQQHDRADEFERLVSAELRKLGDWLAARKDDYASFEKAMAEQREAIVRQVKLLEATRDAVRAWGKAHRDVRNALRTDTRFDAEALARIVTRVRELAEKEDS